MGLEYTGAAWPNPIPFSGYRHLGILPDGRATRDEDLLEGIEAAFDLF